MTLYLCSSQNDREVMLGTLLALIHAHRRCQVVDREAVAQLDSKLKEERKRASEGVGDYKCSPFLTCAFVCMAI